MKQCKAKPKYFETKFSVLDSSNLFIGHLNSGIVRNKTLFMLFQCYNILIAAFLDSGASHNICIHLDLRFYSKNYTKCWIQPIKIRLADKLVVLSSYSIDLCLFLLMEFHRLSLSKLFLC